MNYRESESPTLSRPQGNNFKFLCSFNNPFHFLKIYKVFAVKNLYNMYKLWSKAKIYEPILQFNILQYFP